VLVPHRVGNLGAGRDTPNSSKLAVPRQVRPQAIGVRWKIEDPLVFCCRANLISVVVMDGDLDEWTGLLDWLKLSRITPGLTIGLPWIR
jgi:hypothetical protein